MLCNGKAWLSTAVSFSFIVCTGWFEFSSKKPLWKVKVQITDTTRQTSVKGVDFVKGKGGNAKQFHFIRDPHCSFPLRVHVCYCQTGGSYKTYLLILSTSTCGTWKEILRLSSSISQIIGLKYASGMLRVKMWFKAPSIQKDLSWLLAIHKNIDKSLILSCI